MTHLRAAQAMTDRLARRDGLLHARKSPSLDPLFSFSFLAHGLSGIVFFISVFLLSSFLLSFACVVWSHCSFLCAVRDGPSSLDAVKTSIRDIGQRPPPSHLRQPNSRILIALPHRIHPLASLYSPPSATPRAPTPTPRVRRKPSGEGPKTKDAMLTHHQIINCTICPV